MKYPFLILLTIGFFMQKPIKTFAQNNKILSDISFLDTEDNKFTHKDIPTGEPLLLVYFRTDCPSCRHMAQVIKQTASDYPLMIWMVSPNDRETLGVFEYMVGLTNIKNVKVLRDYRSLMHQTFSFELLPFCVLFNVKGEKVKTYDYLPDAAMVIKDL